MKRIEDLTATENVKKDQMAKTNVSSGIMYYVESILRIYDYEIQQILVDLKHIDKKMVEHGTYFHEMFENHGFVFMDLMDDLLDLKYSKMNQLASVKAKYANTYAIITAMKQNAGEARTC